MVRRIARTCGADAPWKTVEPAIRGWWRSGSRACRGPAGGGGGADNGECGGFFRFIGLRQVKNVLAQ